VYFERLERFSAWLREAGMPAELPGGAFYLWVPVPERFAAENGAAGAVAAGAVAASPAVVAGAVAAGAVAAGAVAPSPAVVAGAVAASPAVVAGAVAAGPAVALSRFFAAAGGFISSPGDAYGPDGTGFVRLAMVQPMERLQLAAERLLRATSP
jgi:aspartate/methionine/tyrosine aminotransferase